MEFVGNTAKEWISKRVFQENKARQNFPKNEQPTNGLSVFDYLVGVCVSAGKKFLLFGKFGVLCFLETPGLRFALLPYYQQNVLPSWNLVTQKRIAKGRCFTEKKNIQNDSSTLSRLGKNNTSVILETADAIADDRSEINLAT